MASRHFVSMSATSTRAILTTGYELLASGGALVAVLDAAVEEGKRSADKHIADVFANCHYPDKRATGVSLFSQLTKLFESGDLKVSPVCSIFMSLVDRYAHPAQQRRSTPRRACHDTDRP